MDQMSLLRECTQLVMLLAKTKATMKVVVVSPDLFTLLKKAADVTNTNARQVTPSSLVISYQGEGYGAELVILMDSSSAAS